MMRFLAIATALAFSVGAVSMAQACEYMKSAKKEQQIVATDKATKAPSTPIVIPEKADKSKG